MQGLCNHGRPIRTALVAHGPCLQTIVAQASGVQADSTQLQLQQLSRIHTTLGLQAEEAGVSYSVVRFLFCLQAAVFHAALPAYAHNEPQTSGPSEEAEASSSCSSSNSTTATSKRPPYIPLDDPELNLYLR